MCGLTGYFEFNGTVTSTETLREMLLLQNHRGPDDSGIVAVNFIKNILQAYPHEQVVQVADSCSLMLGFNRLSILDTSVNGHQPMLNSDKTVVLMLNGEIYNAFDFKADLERKGYVFKSGTDTEVVLNLYLEYGIETMLSMLNGMFAIVVADLRNQKLYLARDRFGIKPLYILNEDNRLSFSSEMKSFKALPGFKFTLDKSQLSEFLLFRNTINNTLFENVTNLKPGTYLEVETSGGFKQKTFYDFLNDGINPVENTKAKTHIETALKNSVERQMLSDVKLGCQLSGGVDSSLVTHYAKKAIPKDQLETVSIVFEDEKFSEKKYIDEVTSKLDLKSHQFALNQEYYLNHLDEVTWHFEQPVNHPNTIGIYLLSEQAKKHVTVLLSGEGADEILAGYERFKNQTQSPWKLKPFLYNWYKSKWSLSLLNRTYLDADARMVLSSSFGSPVHAQELYADFSLSDALSQRLAILRNISDVHVKRQRRYEVLTYLPDLLMRQDKTSMAHSIENRVPFLDNEMVTSAFEVQDDVLIEMEGEKLEGKNVLKQICAGHFSHDFAYRKKMGFSVPLKQFFLDENFINRWNYEILPSVKKRGVFTLDSYTLTSEKVSKMSSTQLDHIWLMLSFEIWAHKYLD